MALNGAKANSLLFLASLDSWIWAEVAFFGKSGFVDLAAGRSKCVFFCALFCIFSGDRPKIRAQKRPGTPQHTTIAITAASFRTSRGSSNCCRMGPDLKVEIYYNLEFQAIINLQMDKEITG